MADKSLAVLWFANNLRPFEVRCCCTESRSHWAMVGVFLGRLVEWFAGSRECFAGQPRTGWVLGLCNDSIVDFRNDFVAGDCTDFVPGPCNDSVVGSRNDFVSGPRTDFAPELYNDSVVDSRNDFFAAPGTGFVVEPRTVVGLGTVVVGRGTVVVGLDTVAVGLGTAVKLGTVVELGIGYLPGSHNFASLDTDSSAAFRTFVGSKIESAAEPRNIAGPGTDSSAFAGQGSYSAVEFDIESLEGFGNYFRNADCNLPDR